LDALDQRRRNRRGQHRASVLDRPVDGHEVHRPLLVQLVELQERLKVNHLGQFVVGHGGQLQLPQLDAASPHGHQDIERADAPGGQPVGDLLADVRPRLAGLRRRRVQGDRESLFDDGPAAAPRADRCSGLRVVPFQCKELGHKV
jgi:hypothetical protein